MILTTLILAAAVCGQAAPAAKKPASVPAQPVKLDEAHRREMFNARWQGGMWATGLAEFRYPFSELEKHPDDPAWGKQYLAARHEYYLERRTAARDAVAKKYGVGTDAIERVEKEGDEKKWKVSETPRLFDPSWVRREPAKKASTRKKRR